MVVQSKGWLSATDIIRNEIFFVVTLNQILLEYVHDNMVKRPSDNQPFHGATNALSGSPNLCSA